MAINKPTKIITHHAVSLKTHTHLDVGQWHFDRWKGYSPSQLRTDMARYAGYHIIINWDGSIEHCRSYHEEGIHCKGQNFSSIGVCFMGNNDVHYPSKEQQEAWREVYRRIHERFPHITQGDIYPHRKYSNKSCHGKLLSDTYYSDILGELDEALSISKLLKRVSQLEKIIQLQSRLIALITGRRIK